MKLFKKMFVKKMYLFFKIQKNRTCGELATTDYPSGDVLEALIRNAPSNAPSYRI